MFPESAGLMIAMFGGPAGNTIGLRKGFEPATTHG
jgi:hypothetical protein